MTNKSRKYQDYDSDYEDEDNVKPKKDPRRPIKNWKKKWIECQDDPDELEEFYVK